MNVGKFPPSLRTILHRYRARIVTGNVFESSCSVKISKHVCFHSDSKKDFQVVLGSINLAKPEPSHQTLEVVETIIHEQYRETPESVYNDIGDYCLLIGYCLWISDILGSHFYDHVTFVS